jgi:regulator of protease activity HflC (stomatin/prohibitin superfamily)
MEAPLISYDKPRRERRLRRVWRRFVERSLPMIVIFLMMTTLVSVIFAPFVVVTVPSGYVGVLWKRFGGGTVLDPRLLKNEGLRITLPWNLLFLYDLRLQSVTESYNAISRDGISLTASINIRFRLKRSAVPQLHQSIGPNYIDALIAPEVGNRMREVIADYTAEDIYSTKRAEIQEKIRQRAEAMLGEKMMTGGVSEEEYAPYRIPLYAMLNLIDTLILGIELPDAVVTAINRKIEQYYISEEYKFRVAREIRESERKKIEAEGISEFQRIVSKGISDSYLRWRGIEATLQLAQSSNSKIVIVRGGKGGVPIILNASPSPEQEKPSGTEETAPKKRTTAAAPASPSEKIPADNLPKPSEKVPSSTEPAEAPRVSDLLPSLSDLKALVSPIIETVQPKPADTAKPDSNSSKKPPAEQQH